VGRFLVLDWDHHQLHVLAGTVRQGKARVDKAIALAETQSPNPADAAALGRLLAERVKAAGIAPAPVIACLGRDRVILRDVLYPQVGPGEEAAVVRFQVVRELTEPASEVVIDYTPAPDRVLNGQQRALALILRRELLRAYQEICKAAGLKLAGMAPRVFGSAALVQHLIATGAAPAPNPADAAVGVLVVGRPWAEFCVMHAGGVSLARSLSGAPATLPGEVRRNLAVYAGQAPQRPLRALYVAGGTDGAALCDRLEQTLGIPVHLFEPVGGLGLPSESQGAFAGALGLLHTQAVRGALPINFARPKEPRVQRDPNRRRLALAGAVAALVFLGLGALCFAKISARDRELQAMFDEKTELDRQYARLEDDVKRVKALDEWSQGEVVWLDELYDMADRFPDPANIRLTQLTGDPIARTGKDPHVARMMLKGIMSNDYAGVNQLESRLVADGHYRVEPKTVSRNTGAERFRFPQQFAQRVEIEKIPPDKYVRRLPEQASDESRGSGRNRRRGRRNDSDFGFGGFDGGQP
jgi:Tfp pilus assembly PilM family ATPase